MIKRGVSLFLYERVFPVTGYIALATGSGMEDPVYTS